jgi:hypothetical protein
MNTKYFFVPLLAGAVMMLWIGCVHTSDGLFVAETNAVPVFSTNGVLLGTNYVVTYKVKPSVTNAFGTAGTISHFAPGPWTPIIDGILGAGVAVLSWIAKRKSDQAAVVPALLAGVEKAKNSDEVQTEIHRVAGQTGVQRNLKRTLRKHQEQQARQDFGK